MTDIGPLGLPYSQVGEAVQSLAGVLTDRGHDEGAIRAALTLDFDEGEFWMDVLGPAVDALAERLELDPFPAEDGDDA